MTKIEELKKAYSLTEESPVELVVAGDTQEAQDAWIRYYNLAHNLMPQLLEAADKLRIMVEVFNRKEPEPIVAFAVIEQARHALEELK